ncbi:MAG: tetratricopeptide repeat protein [Candidatus Binataceae bacterium]
MDQRIYHSFAAAMIIIVSALAPGASSRGASAPAVVKPAAAAMPLYAGMGPVHHPVTTTLPLAQEYFDQGLAFAYGFNHDEAERSFEQAAQIDPKMAMACWGIALVLGPNYNLPGDSERGRKAYDAVERARTLKPGASSEERDLIDALTQRYGENGEGSTARDQAYANAMRTVAHKYPNDLDVQTLFAESLMDLHPWRLWSIDGKPGTDTLEIVTTLEAVLKKDPDHIGANHYYIHAVEASPDPARAMASADRLGALAPGAGHLVHMPAHIYIRTGRFHDSAEVNARAIKADQAFFAKSKEGGVYPLMYYTHNIHFLCYSEMMEGRGRDALSSARLLETRVPLDGVRAMPMAEFLVSLPYLVEARFGLWDAILKEPEPPEDLPFTSAMWHYARALAFSAKGNRSQAASEQKQLEAAAIAISPNRPLGTSNRAKDVMEVAVVVVAGELAVARGDHSGAVAKLTDAVRKQDALVYEEPPIWYFPVRESLGAQLLAIGRTQDAEAIYREDLRINPGNPRSLYGLAQCLSAEGKTAEAAKAREQFRKAWRFADGEPAPPPAAKRGKG